MSNDARKKEVLEIVESVLACDSDVPGGRLLIGGANALISAGYSPEEATNQMEQLARNQFEKLIRDFRALRKTEDYNRRLMQQH